ncbi:MAG: class I SAM-dependent methyltransferase [Spirosomataceae bacterium]
MNPTLKKDLLELYRQFKEEDAAKANRLDRWRNLEPESAAFISILVRSQQSKWVLELGTSNGFSTLWLADAVTGTDGKLVSVEIDKNRTELAEKHLSRFRLLTAVELITADAKDYLATAEAIFDLIFLDAERSSYVAYWPHLRRLLTQKGALLIVDNVLSHKNEVASFISLIEQEAGFVFSIVPLGAGLLLVTKQ